MFIMYDFDGTLIDSTEGIYEALCKAINKKLDINLCKSQIGLPLDKIMRNLGVNENEVEKVIKSYKNHYSTIYLEKTKLIDGAKESLALAKQYAKIGLVTTKTSEYSKNLLNHLGIFEYFDVIVGREDVVNPKPDKEPILKAISLANIKKDEKCFMIGDTIYDLLAAKNAGIIGVGTIYEYQSKDELLRYSDYVCKNVLDATKKAIELS